MIFCHWCYEEILPNKINKGECVTKNDGTENYHVECFAEMQGVTLVEDEKDDG